MSEQSQQSDPTEPCPYCLAEVSTAAIRCRHCAADIAPPAPTSGLGTLLFVGIALAVFGVILGASHGDDAALGWVVVGAGGMVLQIAAVAWGVSLGMRDHDSRAYVRRHRAADGLIT